jgi:hypothetical protein
MFLASFAASAHPKGTTKPSVCVPLFLWIPSEQTKARGYMVVGAGFTQTLAGPNEPTILPSSEFELLMEVSQKTYRDPRGAERPYLTSEEVRYLSIQRGSLDSNERLQIESHVKHSFSFLAQSP